MRLDLPIPDLITALVAGGGVVLSFGVGAALLLRGGPGRRANRFLGGFLIAGGLTLLHEVVVSLELHRLSHHFWITPLLYTFSLGPLIYAFVRARVDPDWRLGMGDWKHAALPLYQIGHEWVTGFAPLSFKSWFWKTPYSGLYSALDTWVFVLSFGAYLVAARRRLPGAPDTPWLDRLVKGCLLILAVAFVTQVVYWTPLGSESTRDWIQLVEALAYSSLLYWTLLTGWAHTRPRPAAPAPPRQETYGIDAASLTRHTEALRGFVTRERPYLDPDLTLPALARKLGLGDKELSYVLNAGLGVGYTDYVNGLRVEEAKRRLRDPAHAEAAVLEVALGAGFASKATFNRVFKRATGQTPTAFRTAHGRLIPS